MCVRGENVSAFSLFYLCFVKSCQNYRVSLPKKPLNFTTMSLWKWLFAAWIYEEFFDNDSKNRSCDDSFSDNSFRDYDYEDFEDDL